MNSDRRNQVIAAATLAYFAAVMQRSTMGVASLEAASRFNTTASELATMAVMQLAVYAAMQIPVGLLLDRFGARKMMLIGASAMITGQLIVASSSVLQAAYLGRALVGFGDAFIFISLVRLNVSWHESQLVAKRQQLITSLGQLGQIASAVFFAVLLANIGWFGSFAVSTLVVVVAALCVFAFVIDTPNQASNNLPNSSLGSLLSQLKLNLQNPGVRMSFWVHFTLQSSGSVFALLWGVPYLVAGHGQTVQFATAMLILQTLLGLLFGFVLGHIASRYPKLRVRVVVANALLIICAWLVMALFDSKAPVWLLIVLVVVISSGGPASMYAMDFSRGFVAPERLGSANGFINVGGFLATFSTMALAGVVLDEVRRNTGADTPFTALGFRWAMSTQIVVLLIGLAFFVLELRKTRVHYKI